MKGGTSFRMVAGAIVAAAVIAAAAPAAAAAKEEAKLHFDAGLALVDNEDYAAAAVEFETSVRLFATKMGLYNLANCYKALRRYGDALDALDRLESEFKGKLGTLEREVAALKDTVEGIVGRLDVRVDRDGAAVLVDGADAATSPLAEPLILGPGDHAIEVRLEGYQTSSQTVRIVARGRFEVSFILAPVPAAPPPGTIVGIAPPPLPPAPPTTATAQPPAAVQPAAPPPPARPQRTGKQRVARGFGYASMALGIVSGIFAAGTYMGAYIISEDFQGSRDNYDETVERIDGEGLTWDVVESEDRYWNEVKSNREDGKTLQSVGMGLAIGAGVFIATTITLFIVARPKRAPEKAPANVTAAPNGVAVAF